MCRVQFSCRSFSLSAVRSAFDACQMWAVRLRRGWERGIQHRCQIVPARREGQLLPPKPLGGCRRSLARSLERVWGLRTPTSEQTGPRSGASLRGGHSGSARTTECRPECEISLPPMHAFCNRSGFILVSGGMLHADFCLASTAGGAACQGKAARATALPSPRVAALARVRAVTSFLGEKRKRSCS